MGQQEKVATSLAGAVSEGISASLAPVDAELARHYPGDPGTRQPIHTVYVPGDVFAADTIRSWGDQALAALDEHAPDAATFAKVLGISDALAVPVYDRVRAKPGGSPSRTSASTSRTASASAPTRRRTRPRPAPPASSRRPSPTAPTRRTWASA